MSELHKSGTTRWHWGGSYELVSLAAGSSHTAPLTCEQERREPVDIHFKCNSHGPWCLLHSHSDTHNQVHAFSYDHTHTPVTYGYSHSQIYSETQSPKKAQAWLMPHSIMTATKIALALSPHFILTTALWSGSWSSSHFKKEKAKPQGS